ncbi:alpha/beta fold hydrolase [Streptacidiphilus monticola]|uniref:Alpha/beta fold hydrolase n=1 Tax=Streptacidiphilus monticola TaxID=2161674 RepID=A0ABW1G5Y3_9ACTN
MSQDTPAAVGGPSLTLSESGSGRPVLVLHGGGGPATVAGLAGHLSRTAHVLTPVLPGWDGTPRPADLAGVADLARHYLSLLQDRGLRDVAVVGSSLGGWVAAEMAVGDSAGIVTGLVLIDAVGVRVAAEPIADVFGLDPRGLAELSWHEPERFLVDPAALPPEELARRKANMTTMQALAGDPYMHDPTLLERLAGVRMPVLLLWGESDRVVTPAYGAAYAAALADGRLRVIPEAGHLPHVEQPEATYRALDAYLRLPAAGAPDA